jgi:hypothetical protein
VLLGVSVVFIISNSVRLALYSRGQEIELMQWIGATRGFIQGPFLIEGMLLAMLGTALSIGILSGLYYALPREAVLFLSHTAGLDFLPLPVVASMIAGGGLLGFAGGMVSVGKFLNRGGRTARRKTMPGIGGHITDNPSPVHDLFRGRPGPDSGKLFRMPGRSPCGEQQAGTAARQAPDGEEKTRAQAGARQGALGPRGAGAA